ncbi:MAG: DUF4388 domain-containing protein [Deltaproteobacteria bacterium]|nr:DUF4388 domain-containing protein [Deltaproteobacteria bacterium]
MGVKGRLKDMALVDIIQIFNAERRTVAVHLGSELGYGRVFIKNGRITHAAYREFTGTDAFYQLLAWKDGEFEVEPDAVAPETTINEPAEGIILEGLRRLDESLARGREADSAYAGDTESIRVVNRLIELGILERA